MVQEFELRFKTTNGTRLKLQVSNTTTVRQVKQQLITLLHCDFNQQISLVYETEELYNHQTVGNIPPQTSSIRIQIEEVPFIELQ